jgi:kanamycin kinase
VQGCCALVLKVGTGMERCFIKWTPAGSGIDGIDLTAEAVRLHWAGTYTRVPRVLMHGADAAGAWLMTAALPGQSAVSPRWLQEPARAVWEIGRGLRALHDALPVEHCPFSWSLEDRLADARRRAAAGRLDPETWHTSHRALSLERALELLAELPPIDHLVVCHGDACAPNTLLDDEGRWSGHVDLGALGVADRWADLAVATWSTQWNYGPGWEDHLLAGYGIQGDPARLAYYRLLWDAGP